VCRVGDGVELVQGARAAVSFDHFDLVGFAGVADLEPGHEPVALSLGKRICAFHLDRVLGGDHHERCVQLVCRAVDRDLTLLHAFEHCRLGLR
jgi:hypothetical protein